MTTQEVANQLVALCKKGNSHEAIEQLYSPNIVSTEAAGSPPNGSRQAKGLDDVRAKAKWFAENHETHSTTVEGPLVAGDYFSAAFNLDVTYKPEKRRFNLEVIGLYKVADGKVASQELFFTR